MKKLVSILVVFSLAAAIVGVAQAALPGGPFSYAFYLQNLDQVNTARCSYQFYDTVGGLQYISAQFDIPKEDNVEVYVPGIGGLTSGTYSVVASCDKQVAAVVNLSDTDSGASHRGVSAPATTWYAPAVYDNYYNYSTNMVIQNATASPINITAYIYAPGNPAPVKTTTANNVQGYASVEFDQDGLAELLTNVSYSARIVGTGNIAPVVNIYGRTGSPVAQQLYSYNPFSAGALTFFAPLIMNNYWGYNTALTVQNVGSSTARVRMTYSNGTIETVNIPTNSSYAKYSPGVVGLTAGNTLYSVKIESITGSGVVTAQPVVAFVNQSNVTNRASSYTAFAGGANRVYLPVVYKLYYRYNTSVTCQNVGAAPTTMTITYKGPGVGAPTTSPSILIGKTHEFYQFTDPSLSSVPMNWKGSAVVTASQPIVCVTNENQNLPPEINQSKDMMYTYEGVSP